jgi:two-component system chemotaxis sensor kinase CheA
MLEQDQDVIREFLVESHENLGRLDQELVELEKRPGDKSLLASIFRTIHTIKGTCGFLAFGTLERIAHEAETLLSQLRDGARPLTPELVSLILETVDATRRVLASVEATGGEGTDRFENLTVRLRAAAQNDRMPAQAAEPGTPTQEASAEPVRPDEDTGRSSVADSNIRVGVGLLDKLMDLVGELVLARNQILQFTADREDASLTSTSQRLNLITTELQEGVMKTRMQPIGVVWNKLPRVVRDMAVSLGKSIRLEMDGADTELDRTIIEAIKDPLVHLVRNACDHGIEPPDTRLAAGKPAEGKLTLRACHEGGQVTIEMADDGAGIDVVRVRRRAIEKGIVRPEQAAKLTDREAINLIFQPGFSTAKEVTNVSGRGVGMDVVKSHIEKIGGIADLSSRPGEGTVVKLKIPLTLAIIPGLVVTSGGERFVIPQVSLLELIRLDGDNASRRIEHVHGTPVYRRRGSLLPVAFLNQVLGLEDRAGAEAANMVVLQAGDRQFGLVVDGIQDTQEIVVKPLGKQLKSLEIYAGATIMGDGRVALILDVPGLGQRSGVLAESREQTRGAAEQKTAAVEEQHRLLLFRAGSFERVAVPLSLVARLEEFPRRAIELASGSQVIQYRGSILPLIALQEVLEPGTRGSAVLSAQADPVQVIVFHDGERGVGMVVDQILDVVEDAVHIRQKSRRPGLLGSAVIGKRVADVLDLNCVLQEVARNWGSIAAPSGAGCVLVAEGSAFSRGLIRSGIDMAGYRVLEAGSVAEALARLEEFPVSAVVASGDLPGGGGAALASAIHRRTEWHALPVLALADSPEQARGSGLLKFDHEAMLSALKRSLATC